MWLRFEGGKIEIPKELRHPKVFEELILKLTEKATVVELPLTSVIGSFHFKFQSDMIIPLEMDRTLKELGLNIPENLFWEEFTKDQLESVLKEDYKSLKRLQRKRA